MSLRVKLALAFAFLAALSAAVASSLSYRSASNELYKGVDQSLLVAARGSAKSLTEPAPAGGSSGAEVEGRIDVRPPPPGTGALGNQVFVVQRLNSQGDIVLTGSPELPVNAADRALARLSRGGYSNLRSLSLGSGERLRMASSSVSGGGVVQVARSVDSISRTLDSLRAQAVVLTLLIVLVAALLGAALASTITRRLVSLTGAAERVADTGTLDAPVPVGGSDEIGRLSRVFSRMLASLKASRLKQERLVQDAGHELRTPLTSITTNLSLLDRYSNLDQKERGEILSDLKAEAGEMSQIITDLVALTSIGEDEEMCKVDINQLCLEIGEQASRRYARKVVLSGGSPPMIGKPRALRHAISNLLDNAAKFDDSQSEITIRLSPGHLEVCDRGPGVSESDRHLIFDRFHRSVDSRSAPGSGLGLSIVREVAIQHGGEVSLRERDGGGVAIGFSWSDRLQ